jgi:hypothetical protein
VAGFFVAENWRQVWMNIMESPVEENMFYFGLEASRQAICLEETLSAVREHVQPADASWGERFLDLTGVKKDRLAERRVCNNTDGIKDGPI